MRLKKILSLKQGKSSPPEYDEMKRHVENTEPTAVATHIDYDAVFLWRKPVLAGTLIQKAETRFRRAIKAPNMNTT